MDTQQSPIYNQNKTLRQRITPPFIHHNIFNQTNPSRLTNVRYTPTYASTVFDCEGYSIQATHSPYKKHAQPVSTNRSEPLVYINKAKERKQADLYPCCIIVPDQSHEPEIDQKNRVMEQINCMGGKTSRMRKIVEQISNPIFGSGYFWKPVVSQEEKKNHEYSPEAYSRPKANKSLNKEEVLTLRKSPMQQPQAQKDKNNKNEEDKESIHLPVKTKKAKLNTALQQSKIVSRQKNLTRFKSAANLPKKGFKPMNKK